MADPSQDRTATRARARGDAGGARLLLVIRNGVSVARALPTSGSWLIGRERSADIQIFDPGVSRRQALLHLGADVRVQDLGSANGTRIGERELRGGDPVALQPGEAIEVGSTLLVLAPSPRAPRDPGPRADAAPPLVAWAGDSPAMRDLLRTLERVARGEINVLVLGETGVGKDVVAQEIHRRSPRSAGPFLRINCATLAENLLESELFGHERGAFTGATQAKAGLLEAAAGGTVFLDEVAELAPALQAKLLVVIEERQVRRVGALQGRPVDVRFVSATNRDLVADRGSFRTDLFYRLGAVSLRVPPLRERPEEITRLATLFLERAGRQLGDPAERWLSDSAVSALRSWPWPGNVRELRNVIERAVLLATGPVIARAHLRLDDGVAPPPEAPPATPAPADQPGAGPEQQRLVRALAEVGWNQTRAAEALGIARNTLIARMRRYGIRRPRSRPR